MWDADTGSSIKAGADHSGSAPQKQQTVQINSWVCGWGWKKCPIHGWGKETGNPAGRLSILKEGEWTSGQSLVLELASLGFESGFYHLPALRPRAHGMAPLSSCFLTVETNNISLGGLLGGVEMMDV